MRDLKGNEPEGGGGGERKSDVTFKMSSSATQSLSAVPSVSSKTPINVQEPADC